MSPSKKTIQVKVERTIAALPDEVYDAWLSPKVPGTPWSMGDKLILNPKVDGFFYWLIEGTSHYGRFTKLERSRTIQHTWMSRSTSGEESNVTVTFEKKGTGTLMTLVHSDLPDTDAGKGHEGGWKFFMDGFSKQFTVAATMENKNKKGANA